MIIDFTPCHNEKLAPTPALDSATDAAPSSAYDAAPASAPVAVLLVLLLMLAPNARDIKIC